MTYVASEASAAEITGSFKTLVQEATRVSRQGVNISSILPRDNKDLLSEIDTINRGVEALCQESNCQFTDNDANFKAIVSSLIMMQTSSLETDRVMTASWMTIRSI